MYTSSTVLMGSRYYLKLRTALMGGVSACLLLSTGLLFLSAPAQGLDLLKELNKIKSNYDSSKGANGSNDLDSQEGFRQVLSQATEKTMTTLRKADSFYKNPKIRVPLPDKVAKLGSILKNFGMGKQVDELELRMNRAAEAAVPEAYQLIKQSITDMSITDAKAIFNGGPTSATNYFRTKTSDKMASKFKVIVRESMSKVQVANSYNKLASKASAFGLIKAEDAELENHITKKAMAGLFSTLGEEEAYLRNNPQEALGAMAKKLLGSLQ